VALPEAVRSKVSGRYEALILDLSVGGARLAHTDVLPPRGTCLLRFALKDDPIAVSARIVWSCAVGRAPDGVPLYQSGLAFKKVSDAARESLAAFFKGYALPVAMSASVEPPEDRTESRPGARRRPGTTSAKGTGVRKTGRPQTRRRP
jgi:hypothetical protein